MLKNSKILIAEQDRTVASHIRHILQQAHAVLCMASSGQEVLRLITAERPDLVLMGLPLEGDLDGIETATRIPPELRVALVYLSAESDEATLARAVATAPSGYVIRPVEPRHLLIAMRVALARRRAETESASRREGCLRDGLRRIATAVAETELAARQRPGTGPGAADRSGLGDLSHREWEVLRGLLANGRVPTIARALYISPHTVRNHLKAIFRKLHVCSQGELLERMHTPEIETLH